MPLAPQQIRKLKSRLNQRHVRTREVEGRTIAYLEGWHVVAEANRIFGFDAWDRETVSSECVCTQLRTSASPPPTSRASASRCGPASTVIIGKGWGRGGDRADARTGA